MSENKATCKDSYVLPQGPIGEVGPQGEQGVRGDITPQGPQGPVGPSGRSKIDINIKGADPLYRELVENIDPINTYTLLGTFIYPGNIAFGGDPNSLKMVIETSGLTALTFYNIEVALVELSSHVNNISTTDIVNDYATVRGNAWLTSTSTKLSLNRGLDALSDNEVLVGIYVGNVKTKKGVTEEKGIIKYYSAELY